MEQVYVGRLAAPACRARLHPLFRLFFPLFDERSRREKYDFVAMFVPLSGYRRVAASDKTTLRKEFFQFRCGMRKLLTFNSRLSRLPISSPLCILYRELQGRYIPFKFQFLGDQSVTIFGAKNRKRRKRKVCYEYPRYRGEK